MSADNKNYVEEFNKYLTEIKELQNKLASQLSECDKEQEDILHFIEFGKYDAITMMKATKKLKEVRERRRSIKDECDLLAPVCSRLGSNLLKNFSKNKNYAFKTNVLSEITKLKKI